MNHLYQHHVFLPKNFDHAALNETCAKLPDIVRNIATKLNSGDFPFLACAANSNDHAEMQKIRADLGSFEHIVVLGTGGSSLGGKTCYALIANEFTNAHAKIHFMDNVDPHSFSALMTGLNPKQTAIIAISKSGNTAETLCQLHVLAEWVGHGNLAKQLIVITEPGDNPLRRVGTLAGAAIYDHNPKIGGRFAVLSNVGMLPATLCGLNAGKIRAGANFVLNNLTSAKNPAECAPAFGAALSVALNRKHGISQNIMMPYCDRMRPFASWWRQLWAESLGKNGSGITPVDAIGTIDQHSQLQLYLDGPRDKFFTLMFPSNRNSEKPVAPIGAGDKNLNYLYGRTMGDLMQAEYFATLQTLKNKDLPVRSIEIENLNEESLGALFMHFMLETIIAADLIGINAFDQPAVEEGKILTRDYLSKMQPAA